MPCEKIEFMNAVIKGALAGFIATIPMTLAMKVLHAQLPREERYPLPPRLIVESTAEKLEVQDDLSEENEYALTVTSHFSYGSATGAIYGAGLALQGVEPSITNGVAYGLGVWTISYLGLLPGLGILTPATEHPARRNALMIAAHVVWGAALGAAARRL
jgi:uncharacterized membrane protein YagU involved in acid resistance